MAKMEDYRQEFAERGSTLLSGRLFQGDRVLWSILVMLAIASVLVVYSSTAKMAYDNAAIRSTSSFLITQIVYLGVAIVIVYMSYLANVRFYYRFIPAAFWLSIGFTLLAYAIGSSTNGASRWINILGFQFQPSEALKIATMIYLARQLSMRQGAIARLKILPSMNITTWSSPAQQKIIKDGFRYILMPVLLACGVVAPAHTSSALIIFGASMVVLMIGRISWNELWRVMRFVIILGMLYMVIGAGRSATAGGRVSQWIETWTTTRMHIPPEDLSDTERSMIAIYNGGLTGVGAGKSAMRVEMIHPESDYAYAFLVEEYGSVVGIFMLLMYLWIFFRAITIFRECKTAFPAFMVLGLALLITCRALLHIAVTINFIPETGQTLPLVSRGGSALIFNSIAFGIILGVSRQNGKG